MPLLPAHSSHHHCPPSTHTPPIVAGTGPRMQPNSTSMAGTYVAASSGSRTRSTKNGNTMPHMQPDTDHNMAAGIAQDTATPHTRFTVSATTPRTTRVSSDHASRVAQLQQHSPRIPNIAEDLTPAQRDFKVKNYQLNTYHSKIVYDTPSHGNQLPYSHGENMVLFGTNGILMKCVPIYKNGRHSPKPKKSNSKSIHPVQMIRQYECKARCCDYAIMIGRVEGKLLVYERTDNMGCVIQHSNHDVFPIETSTTHDDDLSLSVQQKEYCLNVSKQDSGKVGRFENMAQEMIDDPNIRVSPAQSSQRKKFASRVRKYLEGCKSPFLTGDELCGHVMTEQEMKDVLNVLMGNERPLNTHFMTSANFQLMKNNIRVLGTDYGQSDAGGMSGFGFVHFEYKNAPEIAEKAVAMNGDGVVQLSIDYVKGFHPTDKFQLGQIGTDDYDHTFYPMGMIIARSENGASAARLISRAVSLVVCAGGSVRLILQDGSVALNSAIDMVDEELGRDEESLGCGEWKDILINCQNDQVDVDGNLVEVIRQLRRRRCFAHVIRGPGRGGGHRGKWGKEVDVEEDTAADVGNYIPEDVEGWDELFQSLELDDNIILDDITQQEIDQMYDQSKRVRVKRELGDFTRTKIRHEKNGKVTLTCNCERFRFWKICKHTIWMEVLHLKQYPAEKGAFDDWNDIHEKAFCALCKDWK